ncbi:MAG: dTDP-fucosamine acetyltransferase [Candidatus Erwinia impunctatus]|nr:dTDP-fucosamine acetyltransferase [Culicoides impunctatus]
MTLAIEVNPQPWESAFFAQRIGRLTITETRDGAAIIEPDNEYDILQAKVAAQQTAHIDALGQLGFQLVEGEMEYVFSVNNTERPAGIRIAREAHIPFLRQSASEAFAFSRFRQPWFKPGESGRFYAQWVENAVRGCFDDQCILAVAPDDEIQGFVSLRRQAEGSGRVGLLATLPHAQGAGVGQRLIHAATDWCRVQGLSRLFVATQSANLAALRLYQRCGGTVASASYWFYR